MRDYLDLETIDFRQTEGDVERGRTRCRRCGCPIARIKRAGRDARVNPDATLHGPSCSNLFARRRASINRSS